MKKLFILGEVRGENEARIGSCFVGASGIELLRMLNEAGIITLTEADHEYFNRFWTSNDPTMVEMVWELHSADIHRSNVFQIRPPGNQLEWFCGARFDGIPGYSALVKAKYVRKEFIGELERLGDELVEQNPNLVLALGNAALWALTGHPGISKVRGTTCYSTHTATGFKVLPTYHPAYVLRKWDERPITVMDLFKAQREMEFPEIRRPKRLIHIDPTIEDIAEYFAEHIHPGVTVGVDIETIGTQITCIGFAPSESTAIVIPFRDTRKKDKCYWPTISEEMAAWRLIRGVLEDRSIKKVFQNGLYDISFIWRSVGIRVFGAEHDTMLLHHALQPELLKSLGFLGSIYTDEGAWKKLRTKATTIKRDA